MDLNISLCLGCDLTSRCASSQGKIWVLCSSLMVHHFVTKEITVWHWSVHSCVMVWQYKTQNSLFCGISPIPTLPQPWPTKAELPSASTHSTMAVMIHHPQIHSSALWMLLSKDTFKMGVTLIALLKSQTESKHSFKDLFNSPRRRHKVLKSVFH